MIKKYFITIMLASLNPSPSLTMEIKPLSSSTLAPPIAHDRPISPISECGICLDSENLISLPCHHTHRYHQACIDRWKKTNPHCPICKAPLSYWYEKYSTGIYYGSFFTILAAVITSKYYTYLISIEDSIA